MLIPKEFNLSGVRVPVWQPYEMSYSLSKGRSGYGPMSMHVARSVARAAMPKKERTETFWHEFLHLALYDMGSNKYRNEGFVNELAKRITEAVYTAKF